MSRHSAKYRHAASAFQKIKSKHRMTVFLDLEKTPPTEESIRNYAEHCVRNGVACILPRFPVHMVPGPETFGIIRTTYKYLVSAAAATGIRIGFHLEPLVEKCFFMTQPQERTAALCSTSLCRREYYCDPNERLHMPLHEGKLMALVAYDDEHMDTIDLRSYVKDGYLDYTVPAGNWTVEEYLCTSAPLRSESVPLSFNRLSTTAALDFMRELFDALGLSALAEPGNHMHTLYVSELCFDAPNRRNWDPEFNELFEARFGFDPAPYYPALYHSTGEESAHIKALFMDCRAEMLRSGCLCALKTFSDRNDMRLIVSSAQPQLPACSWLSGDALANQVFSPCAVHEKSYLYGTNSTHLAASAADNFGSKFVACELFRDYSKLTPNVIYKDTLNSFGHGANLIMAHVDATAPFLKVSPAERLRRILTGSGAKYAYPEFVARIQALLRGGGRINDIAMLYPIYDLHDKVYLYEAPTDDRFEYPNTPYTCNYMTLLNSVSTYAGQDITLLHPQVVNENCRVENGTIVQSTPYQTQSFRILILPGTDMMSLGNMRLVKEFYDQGGKVLAAGSLPIYAFEFGRDDLNAGRDPADVMLSGDYGTAADQEIREIIRHIFGDEALEPSVIRDVFYHTNEKGGEAYYITSNRTASDGTEMTDCASLNGALKSFRIPLDVYMPNMPRFESNGAFNTAYSDFQRLGLVDYIPGGGMISHIHKRRNDDKLDIFFFANTTDRLYDEYIYLRGVYAPSRWDPHNGHNHPLHVRYVRIRDEVYTRVRLHLPQDRGTFLVSDPVPQAGRIRATHRVLPDVTSEIRFSKRFGNDSLD